MNQTQNIGARGAMLSLAFALPSFGVRLPSPVFDREPAPATATSAPAETRTAEPPAPPSEDQVRSAIGAIVDERLAPLMQRADQSNQILNGLMGAVPATPRQAPKPGEDFARLIIALTAAKGIPLVAAQIADNVWGPEGQVVSRALGSNVGSAGGFMVGEEIVGEVIPLLYNRTVIRRMGARVQPIVGSTLIPKVNTGSAATWIGENQNAPKTEPGFGQLRLTPRKLAALVPISNDLLRRALAGQGFAIDATVVEDLVQAFAVAEDAAYLRDDGTGNAPKGIRHQAASENVTASNGVTTAQIEQDLTQLLGGLQDHNVPMQGVGWIMSPREYRKLYIMRDVNGFLTFPELRQPDEGAPEGRLWTYPVNTTNQVPTDLGGSNDESEVYCTAAPQTVIGEEVGMMIDTSTEAAYQDGADVRAAFSLDQTVIRGIMTCDLGLRYAYAVSVKTGVKWGA